GVAAGEGQGFLDAGAAAQTALHLQVHGIIAVRIANGGRAGVSGIGPIAEVPVIGQVAGAGSLVDKIYYKRSRAGGGDLVVTEVGLYARDHPQETAYISRIGTSTRIGNRKA